MKIRTAGGIPPGARRLHYALMFSVSAAWIVALLEARAGDWTLHRLCGAAVACFTVWGWGNAARGGRLRAWLHSWYCGLAAFRSLLGGRGAASEQHDLVLRALIGPCLVLASLAIVTGLPSLITLDRLFQPAAWVLWARLAHALAASALMTLWLAELIALACVALHKLGRGFPGRSLGTRSA
jgi:hypothetical protein